MFIRSLLGVMINHLEQHKNGHHNHVVMLMVLMIMMMTMLTLTLKTVLLVMLMMKDVAKNKCPSLQK